MAKIYYPLLMKYARFKKYKNTQVPKVNFQTKNNYRADNFQEKKTYTYFVIQSAMA